MKFLFIFLAGRGYHIADRKIFPINPYTPPLGLLYLARILEDNGYPVEILDYTAERFNKNESTSPKPRVLIWFFISNHSDKSPKL